MKDLVEIFEDQDRQWNSQSDDDERRCSYCRTYHHRDDLEPMGEQLIHGIHLEDAVICPDCLDELDEH